MGKGNKSKQNTSSTSTVTQITDKTNEEKSEKKEIDLGNKKLQLQRERAEREEAELKKYAEERAKQEKNSATKKKNKKSGPPTQKTSELKPEPKSKEKHIPIPAKVENTSGKWIVQEKMDDSMMQSNSEEYTFDNTQFAEEPTSVPGNCNTPEPVQKKYFIDRNSGDLPSERPKQNWGRRANSFQNPNSSDDPRWNKNTNQSERDVKPQTSENKGWRGGSNSNYNSTDQRKSSFQNRDNRNSRGNNFNQDRNYNPNYRSQDSYNNKKFDNREWGGTYQSYSSSKFDGINDKEFQEFLELSKNQPSINYGKLSEKKGDLFTASDDYSLAHCVAEDMAMGAGIAKTFRSKFGAVGELLNQRQKTGGLAVLQDTTRFIYYLVTKKISRGKPTLHTLWLSLNKLKEHIQENNVNKLAIPQIGCGLDRLDWYTVKQMLEHVFQNVDIEIVVYIWDETWLYGNIQITKMDEIVSSSNELIHETEEQLITEKPKSKIFNFGVDDAAPLKLLKKCTVINAKMELLDIESGTGLVYFGTVDGYESDGFKTLSKKYNISGYKQPKTFGQVVRTRDKNEYIYGLIIKETYNDQANFEGIERGLKTLRNILREERATYIAFEAFVDKIDELLMDKIITMMQYIFHEIEIWICWPKALEHLCPVQNRPY